MQVPVVMPQLGLTMEEGTVSEWLKKPGDEVKKNDFIFVVSTDKADVEVESLDEGRLVKIVVDAGQTVPVGEVVAFLEKEGAESAVSETRNPGLAVQESVAEPKKEAQSQTTTSANESKVLINVDTSDNHQHKGGPPTSPRARRLAKELGIDIDSLKASGPSARIVEQDVRNAAEALSKKAGSVGVNRRRIIADKMTESVQTIPHFSVSAELDALPLMNLYDTLRLQGSTEKGKITVTDLLLKTVAVALQSVPEANATWVNGVVETRTNVDLGLAIATDRGVVAPVIRNADLLGLVDIVLKRSDLIERSRRNRLGVSDVEGGVGTLSNLGMFAVDEFQGIITPGQTFILAVGRIKERPWAEKTLVVRPTIRLKLSMDHRIVDGVTAARLLTKIGELISTPLNIIVNLSELLPGKVG